MEKLLKSNEVVVLLVVHPMSIRRWSKMGLLTFCKLWQCLRYNRLEDSERPINKRHVRGSKKILGGKISGLEKILSGKSGLHGTKSSDSKAQPYLPGLSPGDK